MHGMEENEMFKMEKVGVVIRIWLWRESRNHKENNIRRVREKIWLEGTSKTNCCSGQGYLPLDEESQNLIQAGPGILDLL